MGRIFRDAAERIDASRAGREVSTELRSDPDGRALFLRPYRGRLAALICDAQRDFGTDDPIVDALKAALVEVDDWQPEVDEEQQPLELYDAPRGNGSRL